MSIFLYHNPNCSKSNAANAYLIQNNISFSTINYIERGLTKTELLQLQAKLKLPWIELVRTNEAEWKNNNVNEFCSENEILSALIKYPTLLQRPILVTETKAIIARPLAQLIIFLKNQQLLGNINDINLEKGCCDE